LELRDRDGVREPRGRHRRGPGSPPRPARGLGPLRGRDLDAQDRRAHRVRLLSRCESRPRVPLRQALNCAWRLTAAAPQPLDFLEQLERERGAREIHFDLLLEAKHALDARDCDAGETPRAELAARLDDALRYDIDHEPLLHAADPTNVREAEFD